MGEKEEFTELDRRISKVLYDLDPMQFASMGCPRNEYHNEAREIRKRIFPGIKIGAASRVCSKTFDKFFTGGTRYDRNGKLVETFPTVWGTFKPQDFQEAARQILAIMNQESSPLLFFSLHVVTHTASTSSSSAKAQMSSSISII